MRVGFKIIGATLALFIVGCAVDRYNYNLRHAYVTPQAHLQSGDLEQIVRLVTNATQEPIINVTRPYRDKKPDHIEVLTGYPNGTGGHHFWLEKANSKWRIAGSSQLMY